jgi:hypothetical protein
MRAWVALVVATPLVSSAVAVWLVSRFHWDLAPAAFGSVFAILTLILAARTGIWRFYVLAGSSALTGMMFAIPMKLPHQLELCGVVVGALWLASGCITYIVYRTRHPALAPANTRST